MRGKKKLFSLVALLSILVIIPLAFSLGLVDVPQFTLGSSPSSSIVGPMILSTPTVFADPWRNITDYWDRPGGAPYGGHNVTIGSTVTFHINISDVTDLFAWQVNATWGTAILSLSRIIASEFLARSVNLTSSEILGFVINSTGSVVAAEAIMAETTGETGNGRLVTIEFEIVGYGPTYININDIGTMPAMLLNSTGDSMTPTPTGGYFRNSLQGDADGNTVVDIADISKVIYHRDAGGPGGYDREVDIDDNTSIDIGDYSLVIFNRGRHINFPN